jgi:hypothetical protein
MSSAIWRIYTFIATTPIADIIMKTTPRTGGVTAA